MLKRLGLPAIILGAITVTSPGTALAKDHDRDDRDRNRGEWREHERHERRERVWREDRPRFYFNYGPSYSYNPYVYGQTYAGGYYDRWGVWHPYATNYGYYDRWGRWHPY